VDTPKTHVDAICTALVNVAPSHFGNRARFENVATPVYLWAPGQWKPSDDAGKGGNPKKLANLIVEFDVFIRAAEWADVFALWNALFSEARRRFGNGVVVGDALPTEDQVTTPFEYLTKVGFKSILYEIEIPAEPGTAPTALTPKALAGVTITTITIEPGGAASGDGEIWDNET
jgi:hypothetical protein